MPASSYSCRPVPKTPRAPVAPAPLEEAGTLSSSSCSSCRSPLRVRRHRRILYPASQCRRPPMRDAPDQARRWLLLFSALVFLQIYTEETHTCTGWVAHIDKLAMHVKAHYWSAIAQYKRHSFVTSSVEIRLKTTNNGFTANVDNLQRFREQGSASTLFLNFLSTLDVGIHV